MNILTDAEFELFKDMVYQSCGIVFDNKNRMRLDNKVSERINFHGMDSVKHYQQYLNQRTAERDKEIKVLLDVLTVNETYFFRNTGHFDTLQNHLLPELIETKEKSTAKTGSDNSRPVSSINSNFDFSKFMTTSAGTEKSLFFKKKPKITIWCAGCSTGQEPYSVTIAALEKLGLKKNNIDLKIYATDISDTSLDTARTGIYPKKRLQNMDNNFLNRYFIDRGENIEVTQEVKKHITFMYANLKENSFISNADIIFCRNVMIYFDKEMQKHIVEQFYRSLASEGYLFIGHSETLQGLTDKFKFIVKGKGIVYKKLQEQYSLKNNINDKPKTGLFSGTKET